MRLYRTGRDRDGLPVIRFKYECVEGCHLGTDDPAEFAEHLSECERIFPAVREVVARKIREGVPVVVPTRKIEKDAPGQQDIFRIGAP